MNIQSKTKRSLTMTGLYPKRGSVARRRTVLSQRHAEKKDDKENL